MSSEAPKSFGQRLLRIIQKPSSAELLRRSDWDKNLALQSLLVSTISLFTQRPEIITLCLGLTVGAGVYGIHQERQAKKLAHEMCVRISKEFVKKNAQNSSLDLKAGVTELWQIYKIADEYSVYFMHLLEDAASALGVSVGYDFYVHEGGMRYNFALDNVREKLENKYRNPKKRECFQAFLTLFFQEIRAHKEDFDPTTFFIQLSDDMKKLDQHT